jgi:hypothetical protein
LQSLPSPTLTARNPLLFKVAFTFVRLLVDVTLLMFLLFGMFRIIFQLIFELFPSLFFLLRKCLEVSYLTMIECFTFRRLDHEGHNSEGLDPPHAFWLSIRAFIEIQKIAKLVIGELMTINLAIHSRPPWNIGNNSIDLMKSDN